MFKVTHVRQKRNSASGLPAWLDLRIGIKAVSRFWERGLVVMKSSGAWKEKVLAIQKGWRQELAR